MSKFIKLYSEFIKEHIESEDDLKAKVEKLKLKQADLEGDDKIIASNEIHDLERRIAEFETDRILANVDSDEDYENKAHSNYYGRLEEDTDDNYLKNLMNELDVYPDADFELVDEEDGPSISADIGDSNIALFVDDGKLQLQFATSTIPLELTISREALNVAISIAIDVANK